MLEIDTVDEAIIDADPATVAKAIRDESMGKTHWWLPYWQAKPRGNIPFGQAGGMIDITVRKGVTVRFTAKTVEATENLLRVEYVEGAYRGEGTWTFEPADGKTRLRFCWRVQPAGWLRWLLQLAPPSEKSGQSHHEVMQAGFEGLNAYVKQLDVQAAPAVK